MNAWLYDAIRSPRTRAKPGGALHALTPQALLTALYDHLSQRNGLDPARVGEVVLGCVTQHGEQAANIARTSLLHAGWPAQVGGLTVNRFCSSGLDAVSIAALKVGAGLERAMVAGGVEMMSRELDADPARFNVNGGVIALGHPMGATGAIMLGTLLDELERRGLETGLVAVSGAAGCGSAMLVRRC
jgi:acetyl-CoA C-acetyltransferase